MKTTRVLRTFKQVFNIALILLMLAGLFGWGVSRAAAATPIIEVDPLGHWAHAVDWPNGTTVHLTIVRPPASRPRLCGGCRGRAGPLESRHDGRQFQPVGTAI